MNLSFQIWIFSCYLLQYCVPLIVSYISINNGVNLEHLQYEIFHS